MRAFSAIVMATLALGLAPLVTHGQMQADDSHALSTLQMVDARIGWAVTRLNGVLRTTTGGTRWEEVTPARSGRKARIFRISVLSSLIAWGMPFRPTGTSTYEIFRTIDGGRTWRNVTIPAFAKSISFINPREGWLMSSLNAWAGKEEVEIYRSTDGGTTWTKVANATIADDSSGIPIGGSKSFITFNNPTTGWITGIFLQPGGFFLYVTHDGGRTWRRQNVPAPRELTARWLGFPEPPKFFTARDGILLVFYNLLNDSGHDTGRLVVLYATHDGGATWTHTTPVRVNETDPSYQAVVDMHHAWVMDQGVLRATSDGGRRWMMMPQNPLFTHVRQLDFISPQVGWAVRQTFPFLLKTVDGGRKWSPVTYAILRK